MLKHVDTEYKHYDPIFTIIIPENVDKLERKTLYAKPHWMFTPFRVGLWCTCILCGKQYGIAKINNKLYRVTGKKIQRYWLRYCRHCERLKYINYKVPNELLSKYALKKISKLEIELMTGIKIKDPQLPKRKPLPIIEKYIYNLHFNKLVEIRFFKDELFNKWK